MVFGSWAKYGSLYLVNFVLFAHSQTTSFSFDFICIIISEKNNIYLKFWSIIKKKKIVNENIKPKSIECIKRIFLFVNAKESVVILNFTFRRRKMLNTTITTTKNVTVHRYFWLKCKSYYWRRIWLLIIQFQVSNDGINWGMFFFSLFLRFVLNLTMIVSNSINRNLTHT